MLRVMVLALGLLLAGGASMQEGQQPPPSPVDVDVKPLALADVACSVSISKLQSEKTDDGRTLRITLKNTSDLESMPVELHFFTFSPQGQFLQANRDYVDTMDLPIPAQGTKDTAVAAPSLKDGEHLRVGAVLSGDSECDATRMKKLALAEFEPPDFLIVKGEGTPFTITAAQPQRTEAGIPVRVSYTIEDSALNSATDSVKVAVIAFVYTDRLRGFTVVFDGAKSFVSGRSATGVVNLRLQPLPDPSSKWKVAVMPVEGFFDGQHWLLTGSKAGGIASAALYNARR